MTELRQQDRQTGDLQGVVEELESSAGNIETVRAKQAEYFARLNSHFKQFQDFISFTNDKLQIFDEQLRSLKFLDKDFLDKAFLSLDTSKRKR
jgi:hypothetical protein